MRRASECRSAFWLMLRLLGLIYAAAFLSLWVQARGLFGAHGVLPIAECVRAAGAQLGARAPFVVPSVFFLSASDGAILAACAAGTALGLLAAAGLAVGPSLLGCWALYLSFVSVGRDFMSFQWDILLLETGFLCMLSAPWRLKPKLARWAPPAFGVWLLRLLLLRLMVESGAAKLLSEDPTWRNFTALAYHYWTQPLPTPLAWYADRLPVFLQKASCAVMFVIELVVPFGIFLPRAPRALCAAAISGLMVLIALTGNYCFFNVLGILLCLPLLDDAALARLRVPPLLPALEGKPPRHRALQPVFGAVLLLTVLPFFGFGVREAEPFRLVNRYGLFAIMTTSRNEIELEGSRDGKEWKTYVFKDKPGPLDRRPPIVAPHQPRLDWQMWFAALSECRDNEWLIRTMARLMEGSPEVSALFRVDPFKGGEPPRYLRTTVYSYRFAPPGSKDWWVREKVGPYCPLLKSGGVYHL